MRSRRRASSSGTTSVDGVADHRRQGHVPQRASRRRRRIWSSVREICVRITSEMITVSANPMYSWQGFVRCGLRGRTIDATPDIPAPVPPA